MASITDPYELIPEQIVRYWKEKYGPYLMCYQTEELLVFVENGRLDCFHPSGDRLAKHDKRSGKTVYIWNNNTNEPLTEEQYMCKLSDI